MALTEKFHISMAPETRQEVERRGPRSTVIARDLERYYALLKRGERELAALSDEERRVILDATLSTLFEPWSILHIGAAVQDAYPDARDLARKLADLSDVAKYALVDWLERQRDEGTG